MIRSVLTAGLVLGLASPVHAGTPTTCAPDQAPDRFRLLRQLSLDLFGRIPTFEEYERVKAQTELAAADIDAMFTQEEYFTQVREYFRGRIWGGLPDDLSAVGGLHLVVRQATTNLWFAGNLRNLFRGRFDVTCLDQPQTQFDAAGRPVPISTFADATCRDGTCRQEGYVMVTPYWTTTPIKVCAFDAQALPTGTAPTGTPPACTPFTANAGCGCGANLRYCLPGATSPEHTSIRTALADEAPRIFEWVVRQDRSYLETFTTAHSSVNGPLAQFYRELSGPTIPLRQTGAVGYDLQVTAPARPFADAATWAPIERAPVHAGVLTTPGFMLRFASNRARVNRFYTAFRCEPFLPPAGGLPADPGGLPDPNLRTRPGCGSCHDTIERAAAHWGRWRTTNQVGYLNPTDVSYTAARAECAACTTASCSAFCDAYFVTAHNSTHPGELASWKGWPVARAYLSEAEASAIDLGPRGLVDEPEEQAKVASCAVRSLAEQLLGRELSEDEILNWLPATTDTFARAGYKFTALYRSLVDLPQYRTTR